MTSQGDSNDSNSSRSLYLTEADRHRVTQGLPKPLETQELRKRMFLLLLFWDNLVVSDSTLNNNEKLRPLLLPEIEPRGSKPTEILLDYKYLLEKGYLRVAMREDISGFEELLIEQKSPRPAPNLPTREYAQELDRLIPEEKRLRWRRIEVESLFKQNLVKVFSSSDPLRDHGIPSATSESILRFIQSKGDEPITYRELRHLMDHPADYPQNIISEDASIQMRAIRFRNAIESRISESYRFNVPVALGLDAEATSDTLPWWVTFGDTSVLPNNFAEVSTTPLRPCWVFDSEILGQTPAEAIDEIRSSRSYQEFVSKLRRSAIPKDGDYFAKELQGAWEAYTYELERIIRNYIKFRVSKEKNIMDLELIQAIVYGLARKGLEAVKIKFPLLSILDIPFLVFDLFTDLESLREWKEYRRQWFHLGILTGKPVFRRIS